jgi:hypothetical protein
MPATFSEIPVVLSPADDKDIQKIQVKLVIKNIG